MSKTRKRRSAHLRPSKQKTWQLQEAKARFSELINEVLDEGYQTITKNGKPVVVMVSLQEFQKMKKPKKTLGEFFQESPFSKFNLDIIRDKNSGREADL